MVLSQVGVEEFNRVIPRMSTADALDQAMRFSEEVHMKRIANDYADNLRGYIVAHVRGEVQRSTMISFSRSQNIALRLFQTPSARKRITVWVSLSSQAALNPIVLMDHSSCVAVTVQQHTRDYVGASSGLA